VKRPAVLAVVGATASGKSALALRLAEDLGGEIVSVDSRLLYRGMDIGTAKPTPAERARVVHHLIDIADPDETWSLARVQQAVYQAVAEIAARGRLPLLVGGTGQYMRAVLEGWSPPGRASDSSVRARLEQDVREGRGAQLVEKLHQVDPASAARIDPRNLRRVIRALEIFEATGRPASELRGRTEPPFESHCLGLTMPRPELYDRIDHRIEAMIAAGWVEEVRQLRSRGYDRSLPSMSAIGYRQIAAHLDGELTLDDAVREIRRATRRFVRHQANWFRLDDPAIHWVTPEAGYEAGVAAWARRQFGSASP